MAAGPDVLDAAQLKRIEAVHRGFLYQHLYAVACLFKAGKAGVKFVSVESDEDVELESDEGRNYLQIKTRAEVLTKTDIADALDRFALLRAEHQSSKRKGAAVFTVISNVSPGPNLLKELTADEWPSDTKIYWPGNPPTEAALPEPWTDLAQASAACANLAASLPLGSLLPETLILKLASLVLAASAGIAPRENHRFSADELPSLFEQMALQLQDFPAPPAFYRPLENEPELVSDQKLRAIVGLSGSGKTAWVSQAAVATTANPAYFDVGDTPSTAIAIPLARELAGRFFGSDGGLGSIILPGATGLDMLRALDKRLKAAGKQTIVIIDNAHRVSANDLLTTTDPLPNVRFILLCQPGLFIDQLAALRDIKPEILNGWGSDTVAAAAAEGGCIVTAASIKKTLELTGGLPLYVQSALRITKAEYNGDLSSFCSDIAALTHSETTAQELILSKTFNSLSPTAQNIVAVLSQSDIALSKDEAIAVCEAAVGADAKAFMTAFRELRSAGVVEVFGVEGIKVHDAIRLLGRAYLAGFAKPDIQKAQNALRSVIYKSLVEKRSLQKFSLYVRLLGEMGDIRPLLQFATDELFHELGTFSEIAAVLERASANEDLDAEQRFAALDGLVFDHLRNGNKVEAARRLAIMEDIAKKHDLDDTDKANLGNKIMLHASEMGDAKLVDEHANKLRALFPHDPMRDRISRYNIAYAYSKLGRFRESLSETNKLISEYYDELGITPREVMGRNPDKIWDVLDKRADHTDSLKHLADTLDLQAHTSTKLGVQAPFARIHAIKLYSMVNAIESVARVGQDLADEFMERNDYLGARQVLETNVLPNVINLRMTDYILPVRRQYAVVLAYCGDFAAADAEMARLAPYARGLDPIALREYRSQLALIEKLKKQAPPPQWQMPSVFAGLGLQTVKGGKVGRNQPCPCGSGTKYKKCCGGN